MSAIIEIKLADMLAWWAQQPGRYLSMIQYRNDKGNCGCLMVQYGRHLGLDFESCGDLAWTKWSKNGQNKKAKIIIARLDVSIWSIFNDDIEHKGLIEGEFQNVVKKFKPEYQC